MTGSEREKKGTWIKLFRDIQTHWLWDDKPFSKGQAWIDLLMLAKYQDEKFLDGRGNLVQGKRGCIYRSINSLAQRWGWSRHKVESFLQKLGQDGMIEVSKKRASDRTSIFIVNYGGFQTSGASRGTSQGQVRDKKRDKPGTSQGQAGDIYKNSKERIKKNKEIKEEPAALPSPDDDNLALGFNWDEVT